MQHISEFVYEMSGWIVFMVGITILFLNIHSMAQKYEQMKDILMENPVVYESDIENADAEKVGKHEMMAMLMTGLPCEILIDGMLLTMESYDPYSYDYLRLADEYKKKRIYDEKGNLKRIEYTSEE